VSAGTFVNPVDALLDRIAERPIPTEPKRIHRYVMNLDGLGAVTPRLLQNAPFPRFFWRSRESGFPLAAGGQVAVGRLSEMEEWLQRADAGVRILGGRAFNPDSSGKEGWQSFRGEHFFIPKVEIFESPNGVQLAVQMTAEDHDISKLAEWMEGLQEVNGMGTSWRPGEPSALARWDSPNFHDWAASVNGALLAFQNGKLEKVVLARESKLELAKPCCPFALLEKLTAEAENCFHFCFQPELAGGAFLGASPELLYRREGQFLWGEAVAGTRPRSLDPAEDARLGEQLLQIPKERHEHRVVVEALERNFEQICAHYQHDPEPVILKLARVQHLRTGFRGTLRDDRNDPAILQALHPTPATCGRPTAEARRFLESAEEFGRGWYSGPLGVVSKDEAEFTVAIRSLHLQGAILRAYAGAGIVAGSDPEKEWMELESKIAGPLRILTK